MTSPEHEGEKPSSMLPLSPEEYNEGLEHAIKPGQLGDKGRVRVRMKSLGNNLPAYFEHVSTFRKVRGTYTEAELIVSVLPDEMAMVGVAMDSRGVIETTSIEKLEPGYPPPGVEGYLLGDEDSIDSYQQTDPDEGQPSQFADSQAAH